MISYALLLRMYHVFKDGKEYGVVEGQTYRAVNQETVLEIVTVASEESAARIAENTKLPKAGLSVEILYK